MSRRNDCEQLEMLGASECNNCPHVDECFPKVWQNEWPTEPGWWWFYGHRFKPIGAVEKKELCFVEILRVHSSAPGEDYTPMYITRGHILHKSEGAEGKWQKAVLPKLPKEDA